MNIDAAHGIAAGLQSLQLQTTATPDGAEVQSFVLDALRQDFRANPATQNAYSRRLFGPHRSAFKRQPLDAPWMTGCGIKGAQISAEACDTGHTMAQKMAAALKVMMIKAPDTFQITDTSHPNALLLIKQLGKQSPQRGSPAGKAMSQQADVMYRSALELYAHAAPDASDTTGDAPRGIPPLTFALLLGDTSAVRTCIKAGVPLDEADALGNTASHWAAMLGCEDMLCALRKAGARQKLENRFYGKPCDYLPKFGPERPDFAFVDKDGVMQPVSKSMLGQLLGAHIDDRSFLTPDLLFFFLQKGMASSSDIAAYDWVLPNAATNPMPKPPRLGFRQFEGMGWGVVAVDNMPANTFLGSYVGDFINTEELHMRHALFGYPGYVHEMVPMLFDCSVDKGGMHVPMPFLIDAEARGGIVGRINGVSQVGQGNAIARDGVRQGLPEVNFFSRGAIRAGTQLFYNYGQDYWDKARQQPIVPTRQLHAFEPPQATASNVARGVAYPIQDIHHGAIYGLNLSQMANKKTLSGAARPGALTMLTRKFERQDNAYTLVIADHEHAPEDIKQLLRDLFKDKTGSYFDAYLNRRVSRGRATITGFNPNA